jgi:hypothetical protein
MFLHYVLEISFTLCLGTVLPNYALVLYIQVVLLLIIVVDLCRGQYLTKGHKSLKLILNITLVFYDKI